MFALVKHGREDTVMWYHELYKDEAIQYLSTVIGVK